MPEVRHRASATAHPILLSYLDVVVQGYLEAFGREGVSRFFASTDGWEASVIDDRGQPLYRRHQATSAEERRLTDEWIERLGCRRLRP